MNPQEAKGILTGYPNQEFARCDQCKIIAAVEDYNAVERLRRPHAAKFPTSSITPPHEVISISRNNLKQIYEENAWRILELAIVAPQAFL